MIRIAPMKPEDVEGFKHWGTFTEDLYQEYNFKNPKKLDNLAWYRWKTGYIFANYATIFLEDKPIGYVGLENELRLLGRANLGIVIGADYVDQGYGTLALELFLKYAFLKEGLDVLYLVVAPYNLRGYHVYEKVGFKPVGNQYYPCAFKDLPVHHRDYTYLWKKAIHFLDKWYLPGVKMRLKREDYLERRGLCTSKNKRGLWTWVIPS